MENASKALIMAGEILIAILVIGLFVYIVATFGRFSSNMNEQIADDKVTRFNNEFLQFDGKIDITADKIASMINFVKQSNDDNDLILNDGSVYYTTVYIGTGNIDFFNSRGNECYKQPSTDYYNNAELRRKLNEFVNENNTKYFSCNVESTRISYSSSKPNIIITAKSGDISPTNPTTGRYQYIRFKETKIKDTDGMEFNVTTKSEWLIDGK